MNVSFSSFPDEEILRGDQYESLWTEFLASLQAGNDQQQDEQEKSIVTTTEDDDNEDPEFRLGDAENDIDDDLDEELHVSSKLKFTITFFLLIIFTRLKDGNWLYYWKIMRQY